MKVLYFMKSYSNWLILTFTKDTNSLMAKVETNLMSDMKLFCNNFRCIVKSDGVLTSCGDYKHEIMIMYLLKSLRHMNFNDLTKVT
jgi:hypothetical protein